MCVETEKNNFNLPQEINPRIIIILSFLLILGTAAVFWPVQNYHFLNFDDQVYVVNNSHVRSGLTWDNVSWALLSTDAGFWHPLTWISLMLDSSLYGMNAGGYHWTNVILHIGATLFLFLVLFRMTECPFRSFFVAALFAVHPLHIESVAWIAERKDVLSGFFWMLTMLLYAQYVKKPGIGRYMAVFLSFIFGLMSKPMLVTLPVVLFLLDYWPLNRFHVKKNGKNIYHLLILEKIPFIVIAAAICLLTFITEQRFGAISDIETISWNARISNALVSYVIYIEKTIFPVNLAAYYPHPGVWPLKGTLGAGFLLVFITFVAVNRIRQNAYFLIGWFLYIITLFPVIGFIQLGSMARADRFTYIPLTGIFIAATWLFADVFRNRKFLLISAQIIIILVFVVCSFFQIQYWRNSFTLFQHAAEVTKNNYKAYHGLGMAYYESGYPERAVENIQHSLMLKRNDRAYNDLGVIYMSQNKFANAEREFREALNMKSSDAYLCNNLGAALAAQGKFGDAILNFREALRLNPDYKTAQDNLGKAIKCENINKEKK